MRARHCECSFFAIENKQIIKNTTNNSKIVDREGKTSGEEEWRTTCQDVRDAKAIWCAVRSVAEFAVYVKKSAVWEEKTSCKEAGFAPMIDISARKCLQKVKMYVII